jgi:hypothetical protein
MSRIAGEAFKKLGSLLKPAAGKVAKGAQGAGFDFSTPTLALGVGLPTALFAGDIASGLAGAAKDEFKGFNKMLEAEQRRRRGEQAQALRAQRLQRAMADNMARLAAANPQLYNQLLVGRTLPQGAVVIGGAEKSDFLESVAYQMATGGFERPQSAPESPDALRNLISSY